jgi:phage terminase large subunit GpA-like protein
VIALDDWMEENYIFPAGSPIEGPYRIDLTPYTREILQRLSPTDPCQKVVFIKPTQIGGTAIANGLIAAAIALAPGPVQFVFPTVKMGEKHSKGKLERQFAMIPQVHRHLAVKKSRDSGNTIFLKEFPGGYLAIVGANATDSARSDSIRYLIITDADAIAADVSGEGDPTIFENRTDFYGFKKKIYWESTPLIKGSSHIENQYSMSSKGFFHIPCPSCGGFQALLFGGKDKKYGFKFTRNEKGEITDAFFLCRHCGERIEEKDKYDFMNAGKYVHEEPDNPVKGFKINSFYSPLGAVTWKQIAKEWIEAQGIYPKLQRFFNTRLAESFEIPGAARPDWEKLKARKENYLMGTVPAGGLVLSAGVDTQDNRLAVCVYAIGRNDEAWLVFDAELYGDPNLPDVWNALDNILYRNWPHELGGTIRISNMAIDQQGHRTQAVKKYASTRGPVVIAIMGAKTRQAPRLSRPKSQSVNYKGYEAKGAVNVWTIGTYNEKKDIYGMLALDGTGGNRIHFPQDTTDEFFQQLTAEKLQVKFVKGFAVREWENVRPGGRNDDLDCTVYAFAGASRIMITADLDAIEAGLRVAKVEKKEKPEEKQEDIRIFF